MAKSTIVDVDNGYGAFLKRMRNASKSIDVGILKPNADMPHPSSRDLTIGELAEIHEEGRGVPARPFVSGYWRSQEPAINRMAVSATRSIHEGASVDSAYKELGSNLVDGMRANMPFVGPPPSRGVSAKGSNRNLYQTGTLWRAISYRVNK